jgi:hypothetical protein
MADKIGFEVDINVNNSINAQKSLKAELKETIAQLHRLPEGSAEFDKAAEKAGRLKDKIGDINRVVNNLASDTPKLQALSEGFGAVLGGFQAATGAMALFGIQNDNLQKSLVQVQGAMALANGLQQVFNALQKQSAIVTMATSTANKLAAATFATMGIAVSGTSTAFKVLRTAIMTTGIGALVVGIGLLVDKVMTWTESTKKQTEAQEDLNEAVNVGKDIINTMGAGLIANIALFKNTIKEFSKGDLQALRKELDETVGNAQRELINSTGKSKESIEFWNTALAESNAALSAVDTELGKFSTKQAEAKKETDKTTESIKQQTDAITNSPTAGKADKIAAEDQAKVDSNKAMLDKMKDDNAKSQKDQDDIDKEDADAALAAEQDLQDKKFAIAFQSATAINEVGNAFFAAQLANAEAGSRKEYDIKKKQFNLNKAAAITSGVINTVQGITGALKDYPYPLSLIMAALVGVAGTAATASIASKQFPPYGGGGASGGGSASAPTPISAPTVSPVATGQTTVNPQKVDPSQQTQVKAVVVESDMTQAQEKIKAIKEKNKI